MQSLLDLYRKLNAEQRKILIWGSGVALFIISAFITISLSVTTNNSYSSRNLILVDRNQASSILKEFEKTDIKLQTSNSNGKIMISVDDDNFKMAHLKLSTLDIGDNQLLGYKLFEKSKLGKSTFENNINFIRALEEEIQISLNIIGPILSSKVKISIPKETLFIDNIAKPKVSVILELKPGATLKSKQVQGIKHFISNSIEHLSIENVELIDSSGVSLELNEETETFSRAQKQMAYKKKIEDSLRNKILKTLSPVVGGLANIGAEISVVLDFNKINTFEEVFDPNSVIRSEKTKSHKSNSEKKTKVNGGVPGVTSNIQEKQPDGDKKNSIISNKKEAEGVTNYEISKKTINSINKKYGNVIKIGASITFNELPFKKEELVEIKQKITNIVASTINFNKARGDSISIESFKFFDFHKEETTKEKITGVLGIIGSFLDEYGTGFKYVFVLLLLFLFYKKFILFVSDIKLLDEDEKEESSEMMRLRKSKLDSERRRILEDQFADDNERRDEEKRKLESKIRGQLHTVSDLTEEEEIKYDELLKILKESTKGKEEEIANLIDDLLDVEDDPT